MSLTINTPYRLRASTIKSLDCVIAAVFFADDIITAGKRETCVAPKRIAPTCPTTEIFCPTSESHKEPVVPRLGSEVSFGWAVVSWLVYSIAGLIASVSGGKDFDGFKFVRSFLFTVLVAILAMGLHITPVQAATTYGPFLEQLIPVLLNTGPCTVLIYAFNKLYETIMNLKTKMEAAKLAATSPAKT